MPRTDRSQPMTLELACDIEVEELDKLMAEIRSGVRDQRHFDELEERANTICQNIRIAFRTVKR